MKWSSLQKEQVSSLLKGFIALTTKANLKKVFEKIYSLFYLSWIFSDHKRCLNYKKRKKNSIGLATGFNLIFKRVNWRSDTQSNDIQHNDNQHNGPSYDTQHK